MNTEQFLRAIQLLIDGAGIEQLRITGGEPLISPQFDGFLTRLNSLPLKKISITTNGQFLREKLPVILQAPIATINVSLDTLNPIAFQRINRGGDLHEVLKGIDAALDAGLNIKVNAVPTREHNLDQVIPLLEYCFARGIELRFIELMRMGHLQHTTSFGQALVPMSELLAIIGEAYHFERTDADYDSTALRFQSPGNGAFGIIANESQPFCHSCTRLRLSSAGFLYGCLSNRKRHYIADLLELPSDEALPRLQSVLVAALANKQSKAFSGEETVMRLIGG